ncbi:hypothetical protein G7Y89_g5812 [Cudoniella acicularis]|uniref:Disease resistance R13L4/SHOC-2-like LRR domain-containing protein n=1 Tax=Cudoniella acicularis TaxID=354080 RepID=A0A8H4RLR4_9HELO|nr:hypothetical protein G7Y89_g5812 [Cudoniella acicularis]
MASETTNNVPVVQILSRNNYEDQYIVDLPDALPLPNLPPFSLRVRANIISLTTNNLSYARVGHLFGWWGVHPLPPSIPSKFADPEKYGRISAWGYGTVIESNAKNVDGSLIEVGTEVYGYLPIGTLPVDLLVKPDADVPGQFTDISEHRKDILPIYNRYMIHTPGSECQKPEVKRSRGLDALFQVLFETSYLINRYIFAWESNEFVHPSNADDGWTLEDAQIGDNTTVLSFAASGKTGLSFAHQLKYGRSAMKKPRAIIAIGSDSSRALTEQTGLYDRVLDYNTDAREGENLTSFLALQDDSKVVICDFGSRGGAGDRWAENLRKSIKNVVQISIGGEVLADNPEETNRKFLSRAKPGLKWQIQASRLRSEAMEIHGLKSYFEDFLKAWEFCKENGSRKISDWFGVIPWTTPLGPPLGQATQSTGRPLAENGVSRPPPLSNTVRRIPNTTVRHESSTSTSSSSSQVPISSSQVIALAREAMKTAVEDNQKKAAEASGVSNELKPGVTIDLSHKQIQKFPEEVVDIIKNELERLALSHNQISTFPSRFAECTSLRYLNVRNNVIREFPPCICQLTSLEILDLGRNKLKILPPDLVKLTSLKVLSVQKNRIEILPLYIADMSSLQVLKLDGNPVRFPPKEILQYQSTTPPHSAFQENEIDDIAITSQVKRYLKQKAISDRSETESGGEESSEGTETPRPIKRVMSGRFPIKVNGTDVPDLRSPALPRPPPIPSRSHYRGLSQQNAALRRPGVMPLTIGSSNERVRSNSEGLLQAARSSDRSRRMGIVSRKASELGTVDESKTNRYSHYRGLSHGSAMQAGSNGTNGTVNSRSPASPADSVTQRATYVRRLSSLPERKRESSSPDPVIEAAKGILFALFQVHPLIQNLLGLARDGTNKRTSLERVFYNATTHVEELDRHIQSYITYSEEDEEISPRSNENVHSACLTSVHAYIHVLGLLSRNVETLLDNGDPRYIRTLLLLIYGSAAEVRNAGADFFKHDQSQQSRIPGEIEQTSRFPQRDKSVTPTRERPGISIRSRSATALQTSGNLRVATDAPPPHFLNGAGRSATMTSATPRSGDSFASLNTSSDRLVRGDFTEEDQLFEKIFLHLTRSSELAIMTLPTVNNHFIRAMKLSSQQSSPDTPKQFWQILIQKCTTAQHQAEQLKARLSLIKLKEPGIRTQGSFWELCGSFVSAYTDLVVRVKEAKSITALLPTEVIVLLRPLQKIIKDTSQHIQNSPWGSLAGPQSSNGMSNYGSSYSTHSPALQVPLPMTPQSAALGPAVQATVPSTPQSASYNAMFSGGVFERAEAYLAMNNGSIASSRTGTMSSTLGSNDGMMTPASMLSPMNSFGSRFNGNGKMAF